MEKKEFFINSIKMIEVDGNSNIPTVLLYKSNKKCLIGSEAISEAEYPHGLTEDFKLDVGNIDPKSPSSINHRKFETSVGEKKSAVSLTGDFIHELFKKLDSWLSRHCISRGVNILMAEPLSMQTELVSSAWLSNYRNNLKRILSGKILAGKHIENIDFLPEPFAVFQYYRHGIRHPKVIEKKKYQALVIDFGGGTFDVCIIETTKEGDISQTQKHSKPLAASSVPIGGFYVNRMICEELFLKYFSSKKDKIRKGITTYNNWRNPKSSQDLSTTLIEYRNFVKNFYKAIYSIEYTKIILCNLIDNWDLDVSLAINAPFKLPEDPFIKDSKSIPIQLSANEFRHIFINRVWDQRLKHAIQLALERGKKELKGAPISVVLLSGGSANIKWLSKLIKRDFIELSEAGVEELPDFQEVVAKGLAVECARRFFNREGGDFSSVTYNPLCLVLDPDMTGPEIRPFKPTLDDLPNVMKTPGLLLPAASILRKYVTLPISWKFRLSHPPRKRLDYYFLRSSVDPSDINNLLNIEEHAVYTPKNCFFDANLTIQLIVKEDGTAIPKFYYKRGRSEGESISVNGRPFYIDMTYSQPGDGSNAYIGFDFGTSNSSISFIDERSLITYEKRSEDSSWRELSDLINLLPYPLAIPLIQYFQSESTSLNRKAFEFIESALAMAAYVIYLDYCVSKGKTQSKFFKGFTQRSAGPLWGIIKLCLEQVKGNSPFSIHYKALLKQDNYLLIESFINKFSKVKHDMLNDIDYPRVVQLLANISQKVFSLNLFGFFENVKKQRFGREFEGFFRNAIGPSFWFKDSYNYQGSFYFPEYEPFLVHLHTNVALPLQPLIFWDQCKKHPDIGVGHCYIFDKYNRRDKIYSFKAVGFPCSCDVSHKNQYKSLAQTLDHFIEFDPVIELATVGNMSQIP